jgi:hypothetical protein
MAPLQNQWATSCLQLFTLFNAFRRSLFYKKKEVVSKEAAFFIFSY